jgi:hypothetical protein
MLNFLFVWMLLNAVGLGLICGRKDFHDIFDEIITFVIRPFPFWLISIAVLFILLPTTIPYSLHNIIKKNDTKRDN